MIPQPTPSDRPAAETSTGRGLSAQDADDFDDEGACETCGGTGIIVTCCDDICVARGECIHGDGDEVCPDCDGPW